VVLHSILLLHLTSPSLTISLMLTKWLTFQAGMVIESFNTRDRFFNIVSAFKKVTVKMNLSKERLHILYLTREFFNHD
jgi:hypothetical protein